MNAMAKEVTEVSNQWENHLAVTKLVGADTQCCASTLVQNVLTDEASVQTPVDQDTIHMTMGKSTLAIKVVLKSSVVDKNQSKGAAKDNSGSFALGVMTTADGINNGIIMTSNGDPLSENAKSLVKSATLPTGHQFWMAEANLHVVTDTISAESLVVTDEAAAAGHGQQKCANAMGVAGITSGKDSNNCFAINMVVVSQGVDLLSSSMSGSGLTEGKNHDAKTCGVALSNSGSLSASADGTEVLSVQANFNDTELALASKDVLVRLTHGVKVLVGAASTIIKSGKVGMSKANHNGCHGALRNIILIDPTMLGHDHAKSINEPRHLLKGHAGRNHMDEETQTSHDCCNDKIEYFDCLRATIDSNGKHCHSGNPDRHDHTPKCSCFEIEYNTLSMGGNDKTNHHASGCHSHCEGSPNYGVEDTHNGHLPCMKTVVEAMLRTYHLNNTSTEAIDHKHGGHREQDGLEESNLNGTSPNAVNNTSLMPALANFDGIMPAHLNGTQPVNLLTVSGCGGAPVDGCNKNLCKNNHHTTINWAMPDSMCNKDSKSNVDHIHCCCDNSGVHCLHLMVNIRNVMQIVAADPINGLTHDPHQEDCHHHNGYAANVHSDHGYLRGKYNPLVAVGGNPEDPCLLKSSACQKGLSSEKSSPTNTVQGETECRAELNMVHWMSGHPVCVNHDHVGKHSPEALVCHDGLLCPVVNDCRGPPFLVLVGRCTLEEKPRELTCNRRDNVKACPLHGLSGN